MNPVVLGEEETRTVKYLNNTHDPEEHHSESLTEKHHQRLPHQRRPPALPLNALPPRPHPARPPADHPNIPLAPRHKKGRSGEVEGRERRAWTGRAWAGESGTGSGELLGALRERGSISEMKQYNCSKRLGAKKSKESKEEQSAQSAQSKRRKPKSTEGDFKQIKREIKSLLHASPLHRDTRSSKSSKTSRQQSHELPSERKPRTAKSRATAEAREKELRGIAFTMPLTSKMVSLYSNTSSLFSSKAELEKVDRMHSYVIPTEESLDELPEMRQYESLSLRRRTSGELRRPQLASEVESGWQSTQGIISHYLQLLQSHELDLDRQISSELELSAIPHQNSHKERNDEHSEVLNSLSFPDPPALPQQPSPLSREIDLQQEELSRLNQLIDTIKKGDGQPLDKQLVLHQIKTLIHQHPKPEPALLPPQPPPLLPRDEKKDEKSRLAEAAQELSSSELKESLNLEESMEGLSLEILDKTLREREAYLQERKARELQRLEECVRRDAEWTAERDRLVKWMDHQIREAQLTRRQLWKGFTFASSLIPAHHARTNDIIRCLSDKYLRRTRNHHTRLARARVNQQHHHSDPSDPSEHSEHSQHSQHGHSQRSSDVHISVEEEEEEQLLNSNSNHLKDQFEEYKKSLPPRDHKVEFDNEASSESCGSSGSRRGDSPLLQPPSIGVPSVGLNLQKIECEMDYEDSLNSEELEALARDSEAAKGDSLKLPYALSVEDKEDIFEFIFLDLCIELTDEYAADSPVMRRVAGFIRAMREQARKQKGFRTGTAAIRDYLFQFITFLKNKPDLLADVHLNIDKPLGPTALDILKYMHVYDDDAPEEDGTETVFIMDIRLFEAFETSFLAALQFDTYYDDEDKEKKRRVFLKNAIHIHNKAVFDALNETLDRERPFGVWGEPFAWKKAAKFTHARDVAAKNSLILRAAQRTIEFGAYMCGFIADKEESHLRNHPALTQAYIDQLRDDRLSRLLANELDEAEEKMLFIDDEETEILVELAQGILHQLLLEALHEL